MRRASTPWHQVASATTALTTNVETTSRKEQQRYHQEEQQPRQQHVFGLLLLPSRLFRCFCNIVLLVSAFFLHNFPISLSFALSLSLSPPLSLSLSRFLALAVGTFVAMVPWYMTKIKREMYPGVDVGNFMHCVSFSLFVTGWVGSTASSSGK